MRRFKAEVSRDGKWWMIRVPELDRYVSSDGGINASDVTQAQRLSEVQIQALDFVCTVTGSEPSAVGVWFDARCLACECPLIDHDDEGVCHALDYPKLGLVNNCICPGLEFGPS